MVQWLGLCASTAGGTGLTPGHRNKIPSARFSSTYTKIGTIQRRLAWPLRKDDMKIREAFHIFNQDMEATSMPISRRMDKKAMVGNSLVVQWLRLCTPDTGGLGSIPGQGTRSHMPQLRFYAAK